MLRTRLPGGVCTPAQWLALDALAREGFFVWWDNALHSGETFDEVIERQLRAAKAVEDAIHQAGGTATIAPLDLTESDSIARLATAVTERWDKLDVLVINAAMLPSLTPVTQTNLPRGISTVTSLRLL